jgi:ABC-type nitrate/sulfonate/bicarbonate transport system permease component
VSTITLFSLRIARNVVLLSSVIVAASAGLGSLLRRSWRSFGMPQRYATLAVISLVGISTSAALKPVRWLVAPWPPPNER